MLMCYITTLILFLEKNQAKVYVILWEEVNRILSDVWVFYHREDIHIKIVWYLVFLTKIKQIKNTSQVCYRLYVTYGSQDLYFDFIKYTSREDFYNSFTVSQTIHLIYSRNPSKLNTQ